MDKIIDAMAKYLPSPVLGALLAIGVAFWGVHYWRGFRDYGDTLRDKTFLSIALILAAILCLYFINRSPSVPPSRSLLVLVPFFENDERDQLRTAFTLQLEQAFSRAGHSRAVYALPVSIAEHESAVQTAKRYGAQASVFQPVVIREKDSVKICFHIAFVASDSSKPYAMLPVELPVNTLNEIANSVLALEANTALPEQKNPLIARLESLEKEVGEIKANFAHLASSQRENEIPYSYSRRYAVIVGVNELAAVGFNLKYAISDAQSFGNVLGKYGFDRTLLLGNRATKGSIIEALERLRQVVTDQDLVLFYFAGNTVAQQISGQDKRMLLLYTADSRPDEYRSAITIEELATVLNSIPARHKLAILDGCHGTTGLTSTKSSSGLSVVSLKPQEPVMQFFSGSSDEEYAVESAELGGGAFTQALIKVLEQGIHDGHGHWMRDIVTKTDSVIRSQPNVRQTPKFVTFSGNGEVYWSPTADIR